MEMENEERNEGKAMEKESMGREQHKMKEKSQWIMLYSKL
jgi:hypothetical protein